MHDISGQSVSVWMATAELPPGKALENDITAGVCVVGAGIAGLTTAYLLAHQGKSVVVLDDGPIASGQTQRTTAHLTNAIDNRYFEIERLHGERGAFLAAESHTAAIDRIETILRDNDIKCDFERLDGYLFVPPGDASDVLDRELEAVHRAGLATVEKVRRAPLPFFDTGPCLRFPQQAQFHPLKYLRGLAHAIHRDGGKIFTGAHVDGIANESPARVRTHAGPAVTADAVVVATNTPINDMFAIHTKQAAYLSYVVGFAVERGAIPKALYWDTGHLSESEPVPYHYVRLQSRENGEELLIVGGEDHKTGQAHDADQRYDRLARWARERFPMIREIKFRWSGQVMESFDGLAFIGRNPGDNPNIYVATGDSGMGMTHGTIAGILITDLIIGRENPWQSLYEPSRKTLRATGQFLRENLNVARQYSDWLRGGDVKSDADIAPGHGAIIRRGLSMRAVYRDEQGTPHERSAVCPHLGCIVDWNDAEKTWDCPCHGSRFDCKGSVINGPANRDLREIEEKLARKSA